MPRLRETCMAVYKGQGLVRRAALALAIGTASVAGGVLPPVVQTARADGPASVADLAQGLLDAVVNISTSQTVKGDDGEGSTPIPVPPDGSPFQEFFKDFFGDKGQAQDAPSQKVQSLGSGFIIDAEHGIVVTNNHVISGADDIEVNFNDGGKLKATIVGIDTKTDLAVLKIDPKARKLTAVKFGDSRKMRIGDWVMAIGNPFGLGGSVTTGIVSARNRNINSGPYDDFIQTDAAINRGNSGGPLFNQRGEVIGINTAIISPSGGSIGIGFAIPTELAKGVIDQLIDHGEVRRGWLGVRIEPMTDEVAKSLGINSARGALVAGIIKGGPVDNGSILPGDVIVDFDGQAVAQAHDLPRIVAETPVGKDVNVVVLRKGKQETVKVKLGQLQDTKKEASAGSTEPPADKGGAGPQQPAATATLGMTLGELDGKARADFGIADSVKGVVVTAVDPGSPAAERHVQVGDVIVEVGQETVASPADVLNRIDQLRKSGRKGLLLMLASKTGDLHPVTVLLD